MPRKIQATRQRLAKYSPTIALLQLQEKRTAAAAALQSITNNFDHYLKTMLIAVPITAILLNAATVHEKTIKVVFDITFQARSAALAIMSLGCVFLLYCARAVC